MSSEHRLHPASILFIVGANARQFVVPGLLVLFSAARGDRQWDLVLMALFVPYSIYAIVKYATFRYQYTPEELVIRSGVLVRNERHIPYARIQNIDAVQNVLHRLLDVVTVRVHTGAGAEPEATLSVLPRAAYEEMRVRVGQRHGVDDGAAVDAALPAAVATTILHLPTPEVMLCGFIENYGGIIIGAALGALWEFGLIDSVTDRFVGPDGEDTGPIRDLFRAAFAGGALTPGRVLAVVAAVVSFLLVLRLLSMGVAILKLHGYTLTRVDDDLRAEYGLLTRIAATIPLRRVQTITVRQGPLQRLFGRAAIGVATAGAVASSNDEGERQVRMPIVPIVRRERADALVALIMPEVDASSLQWQPVHPRAAVRIARVNFFVFAILSSPTAWAGGWWYLAWLAALAAWCVVMGHRHAASIAWAESADAVAYRRGWLWRQTTIARMSRVQVLALNESPFDRRHGMAGVRVDTAGGGPLAEHVDIPYLPRAVADGLYDRLSRQTARTAFKW